MTEDKNKMDYIHKLDEVKINAVARDIASFIKGYNLNFGKEKDALYIAMKILSESGDK